MKQGSAGLAYCDRHGRIYYDERSVPLADGGVVREVRADELIPAPPGTVPMLLPQRRPLTRSGPAARRFTLAVALPAGYTRLLVPAYEREGDAPALPLFGYTFACVVDDALHVAAIRTDESEDWQPRTFAEGELEALLELEHRAVGADHRVRLKNIVAGRDFGSSIEVLSGLTADDDVVTNPPDSLIDGTAVQISAARPVSADSPARRQEKIS